MKQTSFLTVLICLVIGAAPALPAASPEVPVPSTPREFYNVGTRELNNGKLREAEASLETALASQNPNLQPAALYNLGHVRFALGLEELKKGPASKQTSARSNAAAQTVASATSDADSALASDDVKRMVDSYLRGRGARRELKAATQAVQNALRVYGNALGKWQRSSGDFKSTVELNGRDAPAQANADAVDRYIARLIDSIREMQEALSAMGKKGDELKEKMKQLKGRIPAPDMPPGASGDEDDDEEMPKGPPPGEKEGESKQGEEMTLSPEQAAWLLNGYKLDSEHRLPMGQENTTQPKDRSGRTW
jgi:tetratricopeptide (TPR) repeat protein